MTLVIFLIRCLRLFAGRGLGMGCGAMLAVVLVRPPASFLSARRANVGNRAVVNGQDSRQRRQYRVLRELLIAEDTRDLVIRGSAVRGLVVGFLRSGNGVLGDPVGLPDREAGARGLANDSLVVVERFAFLRIEGHAIQGIEGRILKLRVQTVFSNAVHNVGRSLFGATACPKKIYRNAK